MIQAVGYAAKSVAAPLERFSFTRRDPGPNDVQIEIASLRHLPLGHPPGPRRMGRLHLPHGSRP